MDSEHSTFTAINELPEISQCDEDLERCVNSFHELQGDRSDSQPEQKIEKDVILISQQQSAEMTIELDSKEQNETTIGVQDKSNKKYSGSHTTSGS